MELEYCLGLKEAKDREQVISVLSRMGFYSVGEARDCSSFLRLLRKVQPQLAVMDASLPGNFKETVSIIMDEDVAALLMVSQNSRVARLELDKSNHITVWPLSSPHQVLASVVEVLGEEYRRRKKLLQQIEKLKHNVYSRSMIERCKGLLMQKHSLDEAQAYRVLQKQSMDSQLPLLRIAEQVLQGEIKVGPGEPGK